MAEDCVKDYEELGIIAWNRLGMQCQYAARYVKESGVRYTGDPEDNYHGVCIHISDIENFINYVRSARGILRA